MLVDGLTLVDDVVDDPQAGLIWLHATLAAGLAWLYAMRTVCQHTAMNMAQDHGV